MDTVEVVYHSDMILALNVGQLLTEHSTVLCVEDCMDMLSDTGENFISSMLS